MKNKYLDSGRRKQKLKTYNKIFDAAQGLLDQGEPLSLENIAKKASISRATIYRYYSNIEVLKAEMTLGLNEIDPESFTSNNPALSTEELILSIQDYYLNFTLDNEATFRTFLGALLNANVPNPNRAGRRIIALEKALSKETSKLSDTDKKHLVNIASLFMGIEAVILTKDVCNLNDQEAKDSLQWGLQMLLKSVLK